MSALLEFRKPAADIVKYPPSAIWRTRKKRRIRLPKGRRQLTKNELEKRFGKAFSFVGDGSMMSYEETRARAEAVQAQRVRSERALILDREVQNDRDRLRLQGEIARIDDRYRQRKLDIEQARFDYRIDQDARREERELALLEQGEARRAEEADRFERVRAEDNARHDRLYDDQRRFLADLAESGERRRGEYDARLLDAIGNLQARQGDNVPLRFVFDDEPEGEADISELTPTPRPELDPTSAAKLRSPTLSAARASLSRALETPAPAPRPEPEPEPEPRREEERRKFVEGGEAGGGSVRLAPKSAPTSPEVVKGRSLLQEQGAQEAILGDIQQQRRVAPVITAKSIIEQERGIEEAPETALQQLGGKVAGVVSAFTGRGGGGVAKVPVRVGEQSGGLGVAIQQEEGGEVAEGVFGATQGEDTFALPDVPETPTTQTLAPQASPRFRQRQRRGGVVAVPKTEGLENPASRVLLKTQEEQGAIGGLSPSPKKP